jgi:hypothetical protein
MGSRLTVYFRPVGYDHERSRMRPGADVPAFQVMR